MADSRLFVGLLLFAVLFNAVFAACAGTTASSREVDMITDQVRDIRGLEEKEAVSFVFVRGREMDVIMRSMMEEDFPRDEVSLMQDVLVILDFLEEGKDLHRIILDVYSEQVTGFYDTETRKMLVLSSPQGLGPMEKVTIAHEYTHALQDQHFDLNSLAEAARGNSDYSLAVLSLIEGDAVLVQLDYIMGNLTDDEYEQLIGEPAEADSLDAAPRFIRETLLFPYLAGAEFCAALGSLEAINRAFESPPRSTEQILHPDRYFEGDEPVEIEFPDLENFPSEGWSLMDTDVLGEFVLRLYLEVFLEAGEAFDAAEGWGGDRYAYLKSEDGKGMLVLHTAWDTARDADEFFEAYISFAERKAGPGRNLLVNEADRMHWTADDVSIYLGRNAYEVLVLIGPAEEVSETVEAFFPDF